MDKFSNKSSNHLSNKLSNKLSKLLVCTDLDRTLIPNGTQPESDSARGYFKYLVAQPQVTFAYVTGRHLELVEQAIADYDLPKPNFIIADVGSSLYQQNHQPEQQLVPSDYWQRVKSWDDHLAVDWQQKTALELAEWVTNIEHCHLQEAEKQGLHKLSLYIDLDAEIDAVIAQVKEKFAATHLQANFIWSIDEQADIGLLDILPSCANKYQAIAFLMEHQAFSLENTIFSGDSGNDRDVLVSPINSVLVANAHMELKQDLSCALEKEERESGKNRSSLYIAQGNFLGMNGNYSAGIIEGIYHYFPGYLSIFIAQSDSNSPSA
jgi:HAD superfamily hydrolase (TIGR01484 family)